MRPVRSLNSLRRPHVASKISTAQQTRHFHPTKPAPFVGEVLGAASGFIYGIHSLTGLPWAYSLPLAAITVRTVVALPLQIYTKRNGEKERHMAPMVQSWSTYFQNEIGAESIANPGETGPTQAKMKVLRQVKDMRKQLRTTFGIPWYYKGVNFLQLPVWISVMESIRGMCGDERGLLRYIGALCSNWWHPGEAYKSLPLQAEPSLSNEGALWFPDLLAGDPTGVLPVLLSASIITNIRTGWKTASPRELADLPRGEMMWRLSMLSLKNVLQFVAVYIGYSASFGMPCALMLYWITSTNMATLQTVLLNKYMASKEPVKPWRKIHVGFRR